MKLQLPNQEVRGEVIDLRGTGVGVTTVLEACPGERAGVLRHVGCIERGMALSTRGALAAVARSWGETAPHDGELTALHERRRTLEGEAKRGDERDVDLRSLRRAVAEADTEVEQLRERVARLQGRVQARREGGTPERAERELAAAARELSEVETERDAARQRLDRLREQRRSDRDVREAQLRLDDRIANLERAARAVLARRARPAFERAVQDVPGADRATVDAGTVTRALAVARIAVVDGPIVLAVDRFEGPEHAHQWLGSPVVRV